LGPKRVRLIYEHLRVHTLEDLRRAAQDGRLRDIRGVGIAVEKKVLAALS
jgi:DNA polymerase (family 10)